MTRRQFLIIGGMAAHSDGTLVVADYRGGAVLEITNPGGANFQSHYVAGTHAKVLDVHIADEAANVGDVDGKGVDARFDGVGVLTVDPNKNIFVFDEWNDKIKMIANDANRRASTVATLKGDKVGAFTYLKGKIYAVGSDGSVDILWSIADPPAPFDAAHPQANLLEITGATFTMWLEGGDYYNPPWGVAQSRDSPRTSPTCSSSSWTPPIFYRPWQWQP